MSYVHIACYFYLVGSCLLAIGTLITLWSTP
jgi:hypothetical protein